MSETVDLNKVLFVLPQHSFSWGQIEDEGLKAQPPYRGKTNVFLRILREIHFRLNFPKKNMWFCPFTGNYDVFFIFADLIIPEYIEWLHKISPSSKFIMYYMNSCNDATNPEKFRYDYLKLWSGDVHDCERYQLNKAPYIGAYSKSWVVNKVTPEYDIFFVGKDKGGKRLNDLLELEAQFKSLGLKTYFHIVAEHQYDRYRSKYYKGFLPYQECLKILGKSKAILYLGYGSQECVTLRVQESLIHKIKLVTDCDWLKNYEFYNPHNIFILGEDSLETLPQFLNSPYEEVETEYLKHIFIDELFKEVIRLS